jgi:hypothetical protein
MWDHRFFYDANVPQHKKMGPEVTGPVGVIRERKIWFEYFHE